MVTVEKETAQIKVRRSTWVRLNRQRREPSETLDAVINRVLDREERESAGAQAE